jgi:hypothetical protein
MDKLEFKQKLYDACALVLQNSLNAIKQAMDEAQSAALEEVTTLDIYESHRSQYLQKTEMFGRQYNKSLETSEILNRLIPLKLNNIVQFGSVVITDSQKLFVSAGIGKIMVTDEEWFAISTQVPIFNALKGKKAGDTIIFNNKKITIIDVY